MTQISPAHLQGLFDSCPDPLAIVEGDTIVARNDAFRLRFGDVPSWSACGAGTEKNAAPMQWTTWPAADGATCIRLDGPAQKRAPVPAALEPLIAGDEPIPLRTLVLGKLFERLDAILWVTAKDGTILLSEGTGLAHYGLASGQLVGRNALQVYPAGSDALDLTRRALAGERIQSDRIEEQDYWIRAVEPIRTAAGEVSALMGFAVCATESTQHTLQAKMLLNAMGELPVAVWAMETDGTCSLSVGKGLRDLGLEPGQLIGANLFELYADRPEFHADMERALSGEQFVADISFGEMRWRNHYIPALDVFGEKVLRVYAVAENVTERTRNEHRLAEQLALIQSQQDAIDALLTPIIEVWDGVLTIVVLGNFNEHRARHVLSHLLEVVADRSSRAVILDLTGAAQVDTTTARHLFDILRGVELLGAIVVVSGITPSVARTMVDLGIQMEARRTYSTLAEALRQLIGSRAGTRRA